MDPSISPPDIESALLRIRQYAREHDLGYGFEPFPMALNPSLQKTHIQNLANRALDPRQIGGLCIN